MKRVHVAAAVMIVIVVLAWYLYNSAYSVRVVGLHELRKEVLTEREEYRIGEPVKAALILYNDHAYPVKFKAITLYGISGYSVSEGKPVAAQVYCTPVQSYTEMDAKSQLVLATHTFNPEHPGEFKINIMGESLSVNVTGTDPPS